MTITIRYLILLSVFAYLVFDFFENRRVMDEREELIRLKSFELTQKMNMWTITALATWFAYDPQMPALYPLAASVLASLYGEIVGRTYYRRKV